MCWRCVHHVLTLCTLRVDVVYIMCWRCVDDMLALCTWCVGVVYLCWRCVHDMLALCTWCDGVVYMCWRCVRDVFTLCTYVVDVKYFSAAATVRRKSTISWRMNMTTYHFFAFPASCPLWRQQRLSRQREVGGRVTCHGMTRRPDDVCLFAMLCSGQQAEPWTSCEWPTFTRRVQSPKRSQYDVRAHVDRHRRTETPVHDHQVPSAESSPCLRQTRSVRICKRSAIINVLCLALITCRYCGSWCFYLNCCILWRQWLATRVGLGDLCSWLERCCADNPPVIPRLFAQTGETIPLVRRRPGNDEPSDDRQASR